MLGTPPDIMAEWLGAFYKHVGNYEMILLMDRLEAYLSAIELVPPPKIIRIAFLSKHLRYIAVPATR
jgi:hypothetical protein